MCVFAGLGVRVHNDVANVTCKATWFKIVNCSYRLMYSHIMVLE